MARWESDRPATRLSSDALVKEREVEDKHCRLLRVCEYLCYRAGGRGRAAIWRRI